MTARPADVADALLEQAERLELEAAARSWRLYPEYRESGVDWLEPIPAHWRLQKLKHTARIQFSNVDKKSEDGEQPVLLCNYVDVYYHDRITSDIEFMEATALPREIVKFQLMPGDVLVTKDSEDPHDICVPAVVAEELPGVLCGYHLAQIRPASGDAYGPYLSYAFASSGIRDQFRMRANGITRFGLSQDDICSSLVPLPPVAEQRAIAAFLDRKTRQIDELIEKKRRLIDLLQEKRTALISHAVTKGLNPDAPMKPSGIDWLGDVPAHWDVKPVGSLVDALVGFPFSSDGFSLEEGTPLVRGDNITTGSLRWGEKSRYWPGEPPHPRYLLAAGDIVIGMDGSKVGRNYAMVAEQDLPLLLVQRVTRLRARPIVQAEFLFHSVATPRFHAHVDTHKTDPAIPHITLKDILSLSVCLPPINEQSEILGFIEIEGGRLGVLIERAEDVFDRLVEYRQALISAAVTGKIDVREEVTP